MIPVKPVPEPPDFGPRARQPGALWLASHPEPERPRDFWSPFKHVLHQGFGERCGYAAMLDLAGGTVDHYISVAARRDLAYEWSNYRFASALMNSIKGGADGSVLDPYEVGEDWFEILLPSMQLVATDRVPPHLREKAAFTLKRLRLGHDERLIRWRQSVYEQYRRGLLTLEGLREYAPLIARAVEKTAQQH